MDHKRTTHSSICELSVLCQLPRVVAEACQSKIRTATGMTTWKQRRRTLSGKSCVATVADQRESRHGDLQGRSTSVHASQSMNWNVPRAKTCMASRGCHTCRLARQPAGACRTTTSAVKRASTTSTTSCHISSSRWPLTSGRYTMQVSPTVVAHAGSRSSPTRERRHGRRDCRSRPKEKLLRVLNYRCND